MNKARTSWMNVMPNRLNLGINNDYTQIIYAELWRHNTVEIKINFLNPVKRNL